jgi:hypothetical protein
MSIDDIGARTAALCAWERANLSDRGDYGLVVVLNKFAEPDAPPVVTKPVQKPAPTMSVVLPGIAPGRTGSYFSSFP